MRSRRRAATIAWGYRFDEGKWSRERLEPDGEVGAMGGLATTAPDYARYVAFLLERLAGARRSGDRPGAPLERARDGPVPRAAVPARAVDGRAPAASAYGYGLMNSADPEARPPAASLRRPAGLRLAHAAAARRGIGVFAFGNRTYAPMSRITLAIAETVHALQPPRAPAAPSPWLKRAVEAVVAAYAAGRIEVAEAVFAENLLLDMPARLRNVELAALKQRLGEGRLESIEPVHALDGRFTMVCANGRLRGDDHPVAGRRARHPGPHPRGRAGLIIGRGADGQAEIACLRSVAALLRS